MSELKCPICGEKIEHIEDGWCNCKNRCTGSGSIELWLQFLHTREQFEMANAELDYIKEQIEKKGAFDNTRKALDESKKCINWVIDTFNKGLEHESDVAGMCELVLLNIDEITETPPENVQSDTKSRPVNVQTTYITDGTTRTFYGRKCKIEFDVPPETQTHITITETKDVK